MKIIFLKLFNFLYYNYIYISNYMMLIFFFSYKLLKNKSVIKNEISKLNSNI